MDKRDKLTWLKKQIVCNHTKMSVGNLGESIVESVLPPHWLKYQGRTSNQGDMRIVNEVTAEILTLEVKVSKRGKFGYRFNLNQKGRANCQNADFVVLLCVTASGLIVPFVIPACLVKHISSLSIRSFPTDYRGKYAQFRQTLNRLNFEVQAL